jgi:hypothetical protein
VRALLTRFDFSFLYLTSAWLALTPDMLHLFVTWVYLMAAWIRSTALAWCFLPTSWALCDSRVLELAEDRTRARKALYSVEDTVEDTAVEHGLLWRMLYTLFGWLNLEDWQMMLELGFFYGIPCEVHLAEEDITEDINEGEDDRGIVDDADNEWGY